MRKTRFTARVLGLLAVGAALVAGACTSEKVVYKDRSLFEQPAAGAADFVGYTDSTTKLTVCGNCHVDHQQAWSQTVHASAWSGLQSSDHAGPTCVACHTVTGNGNIVEDTTAGFLATNDPRYHDVQCESCHGPGLQHVQNPESTEPLAPLAVGMNTGCGECHQGHHPFVEEWQQSLHSNLEAHAVGNPDCIGCHTGDGALQTWGIQTEYLEQDSLTATGAHLAITCATCHDPHSAANPYQLRFSISAHTEQSNLCAKCHHKRGVPDPTSSRGPHSPEGPTLFGYAGWWPQSLKDQYPSGTIIGTHGSDANPGTCATCHMTPLAGAGHTFLAIPCTDTTGVPTADQSCGVQQRDFSACTASGCHGSTDVARSLLTNAESRINDLATELNALIVQIPASEFDDGSDGTYTTGEGARFNYQLSQSPGAVVHNPFLIEALLTASIKQVEHDYNLAPVSGVTLKNILRNGN